MIHYHGTPIGGRKADAELFASARHLLVPWSHPGDIDLAEQFAASFCLDNGAFTAWRQGEPIADWSSYYAWVAEYIGHPAFDFAFIPDVIDGGEEDNDVLLSEWSHGKQVGVPVYHLHESLERAERLSREWPRIALGSSGEFADPGSEKWWKRMNEVMAVLCNSQGRPRCKLHGLRMLNPEIFTRLPLASADSTNATQNGSRKAKQANCSVLMGQRITAERIESFQSASKWTAVSTSKQSSLFALL